MHSKLVPTEPSSKGNARVEVVIPEANGGVIIETLQGVFDTRKVIIAADAWKNKLIKLLGVELLITTMQEQARFVNDKFPVWIWGGDKWFYGFPLYGEPALKAGQDAGRNDMTPEEGTWIPSQRLRDDR
ncbi:hypothetical protein ACHAPJ_004135 [Fusarium lateritium]